MVVLGALLIWGCGVDYDPALSAWREARLNVGQAEASTNGRNRNIHCSTTYCGEESLAEVVRCCKTSFPHGQCFCDIFSVQDCSCIPAMRSKHMAKLCEDLCGQ